MAVDERTLTADLDALEIPLAPHVPRVRRIWRAAWPKLLALAIFLGVWQFLIWIEWKKPYQLASPADTFSYLFDNWSTIWDAMLTTLGRGLRGTRSRSSSVSRWAPESRGYRCYAPRSDR